MYEDIQVHLQKPKVFLTVFHVLGHKALDTHNNQEVGALAWEQTLTTVPSGDTTDWVPKSGHPCAWVGWCIAKDAELPLKYSDLVNAINGKLSGF